MNGYETYTLMPWHANDLFQIVSDPSVTKYLGFRTHTDVAETLTLIENYAKEPAQRRGVRDGKQLAQWRGIWSDGQLVGVAGAERQGHCVAAAIYFDQRARGAGRRFCVPWVRNMFTDPTVHRVFAHCHVDNVPVRRVLERMGATCEGRMRKYAVFPNISPEPADCYLYSIVRGDALTC